MGKGWYLLVIVLNSGNTGDYHIAFKETYFTRGYSLDNISRKCSLRRAAMVPHISALENGSVALERANSDVSGSKHSVDSSISGDGALGVSTGYASDNHKPTNS